MGHWAASRSLLRAESVCRAGSLQVVRAVSSKPETQDDYVLTEIVNNKGVLTLNRPRSLNALNDHMVTKITETLRDWENKVELVVVRGVGEKAFCAGGDVVSMTSGTPTNCQQGKDKFRIDYTMNYVISQLKIPYIALIDGITMGGGVGISRNGRYRIATERTLIAMPETAIGLFPDVGTSYYLSRLEGKLGLYLGLTGQRLKGKDVVKIGFGTHFVESKNIPKIFDAIINSNGDVENVIRPYAQDVSDHTFSLASKMDVINRTFSAPTVEGIMTRLKNEGCEFSKSTWQLLNKMSPISMKITKAELDRGANMSLKECFQMEYRLAKAALEAISSPDFYEGVRAVLKDKDHNPRWQPARLEDVTDEMVNKVFLPISPEEELEL